MKQCSVKDYSLIIGMGQTGFSIAKYLHAQGQPFAVFDTRIDESLGERFRNSFPDATMSFGQLTTELIEGAKDVIASPGISLGEPVFDLIREYKKYIRSDIEIFLKAVNRPVIGITGSNGKSTLTTLVGLALAEAKYHVGVGGNIGVPALDLLQNEYDAYVLELSSFQLELLDSPCFDIACILNISEDHMDRYASFQEYRQAKQRIFKGAGKIVFFTDDENTYPEENVSLDWMPFGVKKRVEKPFYRYFYDQRDGFIKFDERSIIHKEEILLKGDHNIVNALALFSIARQFGISEHDCCEVLRVFSGLKHRCQIVNKYDDGVTYINDSKATNPGATIAAINGLKDDFNSIFLIAGGDGKGSDFSELGNVINKFISNLYLFGQDANKINCYIDDEVDVSLVSSLGEAVQIAKSKAKMGDLILLSPACSSLDMFKNFEARGSEFINYVEESYR